MREFAKYLTGYYTNRPTIAKRLRRKRLAPLVDMISEVYRKKGSVRILDIGGVGQYWSLLEDDIFQKFNVHVVLFNLPGRAGLYQKDYLSYCYGDATGDLWSVLDPASFDIIHSNSVIEHLGDWRQMQRFAHNITAFPGGYFVQTPNFWFPIEPHCMTPFFHWLPRPVRVAVLQRVSLGYWRKADSVSQAVLTIESARLLDRAMVAALFPDATLHREKVLFLTKSFVAIRR